MFNKDKKAENSGANKIPKPNPAPVLPSTPKPTQKTIIQPQARRKKGGCGCGGSTPKQMLNRSNKPNK
ncbi:hypothetical protein SAMN05444487_111124 [Marininema mesophilum]|uniref:Uncharacterized protein n=1 Tax=Marininema mesophilum TaxID=1048340 RepID=A0A1H2ZNM4_9BACL|nr:hypothetical protein [Marininema mesophilum]SDX18424.1 hypothetical protein SAMN05444487_111124 [Marininema mesophilum]